MRFQKPLLQYFLRCRFPLEVAEDCVQETFARLSRADYAALDNPESYLFTIASSVAIDRSRRAKSHSEEAHISIADVEIVSEEPSPARVFEDRQALLRLKAALDELPPKTREIFLLNRMDGLTYTQLAARFGIGISGIEKHMAKALSHIRSRFRDDER